MRARSDEWNFARSVLQCYQCSGVNVCWIKFPRLDSWSLQTKISKCDNWFHSLRTKAPAKRSQHANATYRNIVGRKMLRCIWPPSCDKLHGVGCCWLKFDHFQAWAINTQHVATHHNTKIGSRWRNDSPSKDGILTNNCNNSGVIHDAFTKTLCLTTNKSSLLFAAYWTHDLASQKCM